MSTAAAATRFDAPSLSQIESVVVPTNAPPSGQALRPPLGFFQKRLPVALILAAFPLVALPMAAAVLLSAESWLLWAYIWVFGMTHFVVTLTVYLRSENLRHFTASRANVATFFLVPVAMFVGFDLYHAFRIGAVFPVFGAIFLAAIRLADFNHLNRQSFGVLQLFKARAGVRAPAELKRGENAYFGSLTGLLFVTFLSGGTCPLLQPGGPLTVFRAAGVCFPAVLPLPVAQAAWAGMAMIAAGLFGAAAVRLWQTTRGTPGAGALAAYLLAQTVSALMAAAYFPLYLAALAVHYVEYHVLMVPRCFHTKLDPTSRIDRTFAAVRSRPVAFYLLVLGVAGAVTVCARAGMGMMGRHPGSAEQPFGYLVLIAAFDGLFVFHYFVETLIWKFSDPHFRRELSGLYFAKP